MLTRALPLPGNRIVNCQIRSMNPEPSLGEGRLDCERGEPGSAYNVVWNGEQAAQEGETMRLVSHTFLGLSLNAARCQSHAAHTPLPIFELHATSHTAPEATAGSS